ncbi:MAG: hypothetical protein JST16_09520 [Bdellovibrionales bacterium]|nr:hypothetical protein [Bdellovibrionales bacterium]
MKQLLLLTVFTCSAFADTTKTPALPAVKLFRMPSSRVVAAFEAPTLDKLKGLWKGACQAPTKDIKHATQEIFDFAGDTMVQHSLSFDDSKSCDTPSVDTRIVYKIDSAKPAPKKQLTEVKLTVTKVEVEALTVKGATALSKDQNCGKSAWHKEKVDCSKLKPYSELVGRSMQKRMLTFDGKLYELLVETDGLPADNQADKYERITAMPYKLSPR